MRDIHLEAVHSLEDAASTSGKHAGGVVFHSNGSILELAAEPPIHVFVD